MKNLLAYSLLIAGFLHSCNLKSNTQLSPLDNLKQVDALLAEIREPAQTFEVPFDKPSIVTGKNGTIIHVDPSKLKSSFGYPLQAPIEVELIEMHDEGNMITQLAPTTSNGRILASGGAYFLNMKSAGQQLEIRKGEGLEVEFPKLSKDEMSLFLGERDSMGNINWVQAEQQLANKEFPQKNKKQVRKQTQKKGSNPLDDLIDFIEKGEEVVYSQEEISAQLNYGKNWEAMQKNYQGLEISNFGWINCDRFLNDLSPKTNIRIAISNTSPSSARFMLVFADITSLIMREYFPHLNQLPTFVNIPINKKVTLIALSADEENSYFFQKEFTTAFDQEFEVSFTPATKDEIKAKLSALK